MFSTRNLWYHLWNKHGCLHVHHESEIYHKKALLLLWYDLLQSGFIWHPDDLVTATICLQGRVLYTATAPSGNMKPKDALCHPDFIIISVQKPGSLITETWLPQLWLKGFNGSTKTDCVVRQLGMPKACSWFYGRLLHV